jgi:hypothetical protein
MEVYIRIEEEEQQDHPAYNLYDYEIQLGPQICEVAEIYADTINITTRIFLALVIIAAGISTMMLLPPSLASSGLVTLTMVIGGIGAISGVISVAYLALVAFLVWIMVFRVFSRGLG